MTLVPNALVGTKPVGVTVQQALQHSTGWGIDGSTVLQTRNMMIGLNRLGAPRGQDFLDFMAQTPGNGLTQPGYSYSNFGFEMLRLMVHTQNGVPTPEDIDDYEAFIDSSVFTPAGMCETSYKRQGLLAGVAEPHYAGCERGGTCGQMDFYLLEDAHPYRGAAPPLNELTSPVQFALKAYDPAASTPPDLRFTIYGGASALTSAVGSGALVSTAEDLVRFLRSFRPFFVSGVGTPLVSAAQAGQMFPGFGLNVFNPANIMCPAGAVAAGGGTLLSCYGLGWFIGNDNDGASDTSTVVWHGGNATGSASAVLYHPESDVTVAVIFLRDYVSGGSIARNVLDKALDAIPILVPLTDEELAVSLAHALPSTSDEGVNHTFSHP